jgi:hypothetical protein
MRSAPDTPLTTNVWFEFVLAPASNPKTGWRASWLRRPRQRKSFSEADGGVNKNLARPLTDCCPAVIIPKQDIRVPRQTDSRCLRAGNAVGRHGRNAAGVAAGYWEDMTVFGAFEGVVHASMTLVRLLAVESVHERLPEFRGNVF